MPSAQECFTVMMREQVAPAVRKLGFKGSGSSFVLPVEGYWAIIGFQKSVWSTATELQFTINLTVVSKSEWIAIRERKPYYPERPSPNTHFGPSVWQRRIGELIPVKGNDYWWTLGTDNRSEAVRK